MNYLSENESLRMAQEMSEARDTYFFSHDQEFVQYYDIVAELISPHLKTIHDLMVDLVTESIEKCHDGIDAVDRPCILIVGSGTGAEALRIAKRMPKARIVAVDFSPAMNEEFKKQYARSFPERHFATDIVLFEHDFLSSDCAPQSLTNSLNKYFPFEKFDAAVMGFVTHHYPPQQKLEFYQRMTSMLREGGTLVHGDLFSYGSQWLSGLAHETGERWMRRQLTDPDPNMRSAFEKIRHIADRLLDAWVQHWNNTHIYSPIDHQCDNMFAQAKSNPVSQIAMLRQLGFSEIECPFRLWEVGVIWARSPSLNSVRFSIK
jgi:SAM-dependent methyltransferase